MQHHYTVFLVLDAISSLIDIVIVIVIVLLSFYCYYMVEYIAAYCVGFQLFDLLNKRNTIFFFLSKPLKLMFFCPCL